MKAWQYRPNTYDVNLEIALDVSPALYSKLRHNSGPEELESLLPVEWLKHHASAQPVVEVPAQSVA